MRAQVWPPASWPAKRAFLRLRVIGRVVFSAGLCCRRGCVFGRVAVHLDAAIGQEDLPAVPVRVDMAELLARTGFGRDTAALHGQPEAEAFDRRSRSVLPDSAALVGGVASDSGLDLVDFRDAAQAPGGDPGCGPGCGPGAVFLADVVQFAACVGPATGQRQGLAADAPMRRGSARASYPV